jgi:AAA domain
MSRSRQTFTDERSERLLLGQLVAHPDRLAEMALPAEALHGTRRELFVALGAQANLDFGKLPRELRDLAFDVASEWREHPAPLHELVPALQEAAARARLAAAGRVLLRAATLDDATERDAQVAQALADVSTSAADPRVGVLLAEVEPEDVAWLWRGRLALGKLSILTGDPDVGKTTLALDLGARVSTGEPMPGETAWRAPAGVVIVTAEDGLADTIRPRLAAAGADLTRCLAARPEDEAVVLDAAGLVWLRRACVRVSAALIILDPLVAMMPGVVDGWRDQDVRAMLRPVSALAEELRAAVLAIRHTRKSGGRPIDAGGGSRGLGAAARVEMLAAINPEDPEGRVLARVKSNLSAPWPSLTYALVPEARTVRVQWGHESTHTAAALLAAAESEEGEGGTLSRAETIIRELLRDGPRPSRDLDAAAEAEGVSRRTLMRARAKLGILAVQRQRRWLVELPPADQEASGNGNGTVASWQPESPKADENRPDGAGGQESGSQSARVQSENAPGTLARPVDGREEDGSWSA